MVRHCFRIGILAALSLVGASIDASLSRGAEPLLREQRAITVLGVPETWQLKWKEAPSTICGPDNVVMAITCPCSGFAYGEYGTLLLIRRHGTAEIERMDLRPLFAALEPELVPSAEADGTAVLRHWPLEDDDFDREANGDSGLVAEITRRPPIPIMQFADYDHDGEATEFLVPVGTITCGQSLFAAVGISASEPHLHALASIANPDAPLIMSQGAWQALRDGAGPSAVQTEICGDHGSDIRSEVIVSADKGEIHVRYHAFSCRTDRMPEKLVEDRDE